MKKLCHTQSLKLIIQRYGQKLTIVANKIASVTREEPHLSLLISKDASKKNIQEKLQGVPIHWDNNLQEQIKED